MRKYQTDLIDRPARCNYSNNRRKRKQKRSLKYVLDTVLVYSLLNIEHKKQLETFYLRV
jgi:hypothetical protein